MKLTSVSTALLFIILPVVCAWSSDRILLRDVEVLTLYQGRFTTGRRSGRLPQLQCVGGSAGCSAFVPKVVQCYNRGSDGNDVQWECKTDMDNEYRFGEISVSCEGYDYPDDPFILKGSCGLEYTIELTKGGYGQRSYHGDSQYPSHGKQSLLSSLFTLLVVCGIVYFIYVKFLSGNNTQDSPPPYTAAPPPAGFRPEYVPPPSSGYSYDNPSYGCDPGTGIPRGSGSTGTGGGFWSGAATGGILGYLFGSRSTRHNYYQPTNGWGSSRWGSSGLGASSGWGSSSGLGSSGWGRSTFSGGMGSSGTRTASGFGGTKRR